MVAYSERILSRIFKQCHLARSKKGGGLLDTTPQSIWGGLHTTFNSSGSNKETRAIYKDWLVDSDASER